jgi:hypothetical protein
MRLSAEVALKAGAQAPAETAVRLREAIKLAARCSQRMLELRAATSLARVTGDPADDSRLRACYESFEEGHATIDLMTARSLIDGAGSAAPAR